MMEVATLVVIAKSFAQSDASDLQMHPGLRKLAGQHINTIHVTDARSARQGVAYGVLRMPTKSTNRERT